MVDVRPFRAVRYNTRRFGSDLSSLICPPYDVIPPAQDAALRERSAQNMIRLELPAADSARGDRYQSAARQYREWLANETLAVDVEPSLYAYLQSFVQDGVPGVRRGMIAALRLAPWDANEVRPHERTHAGPKQDRLALIQACRANFSPIWCLYDDSTGATDRLWDWIGDRPADVRATDDDGVVHQIWRVSEPSVVRDVQDSLAQGPAYIADGHHRYETALHYRDEAREEAANPSDDAAWNFALTYLVEASDPGLVVLGTHRIISGAAAREIDGDSLRRSLNEAFDLTAFEGSATDLLAKVDAGDGRPSFGIWAPSRGLKAIAQLRAGDIVPEEAAPGHSPAWRKLDLAALHALAIDRLFPRGSATLFADGQLEYTRDIRDVERADPAAISFLARTTPVQQVMAVADAGDRMPEKSTYFYPKPASGLVIAQCDEILPARV